MKTLFIICLMFLITLETNFSQTHQDLEKAVNDLASQMSSEAPYAMQSRIIIGNIVTGSYVSDRMHNDLRKELLKNRKLRNYFRVISNEYTRFISRTTSEREILNIADKAEADYILKGEIQRVDDERVEIFLIIINLSSMTEVGVSTNYHYEKSDEFDVAYQSYNQKVLGGLYVNWGILNPQNIYFDNKIESFKNIDAGLAAITGGPYQVLVPVDTYFEISFSYYGGKFKNELSHFIPQNSGSSINIENIKLKRFDVSSAKVAFYLAPRISSSLFVILGGGVTYGVNKLSGTKIDNEESNSNPWSRRSEDNSSDHYLTFFSPALSGGVIFNLSEHFALVGKYYQSFESMDTEWKGFKVGFILSWAK